MASKLKAVGCIRQRGKRYAAVICSTSLRHTCTQQRSQRRSAMKRLWKYVSMHAYQTHKGHVNAESKLGTSCDSIRASKRQMDSSVRGISTTRHAWRMLCRRSNL